MSVSPTYRPLNRSSTSELPDLFPARASSIPLHQHSLMSGFGGPPQGRGCYIAATSGTTVTRTISFRVPAGVTAVGLSVLMSGRGVVSFTSTEDATGTELRTNMTFFGTPSLDSATWAHSGYNGDTATAGGRGLVVRAAEQWDFDWVDVTMSVIPDSGMDLTTYSLVVHPIHMPR